MPTQNLNAQTIPLMGKHLIEASAGTGKTHNITRLYLRLLLERRLPVEKILVMTFTKDATEELRGRIESFLRQAINNWTTLIKEDDFFIEIAKKVDQNTAMALLKKALLFLDEASIYTIHGFCKRVLSQHAFTSGLPFNAEMEADSQELVIESCQDYYRVLAQESIDEFLLLAQFWPDPRSFLSHFSQAIANQQPLEVLSPHHISGVFLQDVKKALKDLETNHQALVTYLVDVKKGEERAIRLAELNALVLWLNTMAATKVEDFNSGQLPIMPDAFIDGRRYGRSKFKTEIIEIFNNLNQVKEQIKTLDKQMSKALAFCLVRTGIYKIRAAVTIKKESHNILTFDDLITTLAHCLSIENDLEGKFATTLVKQYPVALVDEFQDTDPQQFSILKAIYYRYATGNNTNVDADDVDNKSSQSAIYMIGDPKQAIYGFRGGDVFAYLAARKDCDYQWLMDTNWRSSPSMVTGYNRLFYGNTLSESAHDVFGYNIPYLPVKAAKVDSKSVDESGRKALQFVHFENDSNTSKGKVKQSFRADMANWCADEIIRLFNADESLKAQDIAILVRDGSEAKSIKDALHQKQLASVFLSNRANLLHSNETKQLLALLKGVLFVENERWYTAALACGLLGFTPDKLHQLQCDELQWQNLKFSFANFRDEWLNKGFISMALKLMHQYFHISDKDQDRVLTNLLHLFELLQSASGRHRQPQELLYWFEQQISLDNPETEAELRLESDDDLIRIVTQHGAKGLEYPIVFVPFVTRYKDPLRFGARAVNFIKYHQIIDEQSKDSDQTRALVLSLDGSKAAKQAMADEVYAESIRLLYVAVTRAEIRCYLLTTEFDHYHQSPLGLTLKWQKDQDIATNLQRLTIDYTKEIGLLTIPYDELIAKTSREGVIEHTDAPLFMVNKLVDKIIPQVAQFHGRIERDWWLSSFSAISKNLRHGGVSTPDRDHEYNKEHSLIDPQDNNLVSNLLRFTLAKGAHTGNLLHDILEHIDFNQPDWHITMKWPLVKYGELSAGFTEDDLQAWLAQVLSSTLTEANCSLADLTIDKTLRESEFYFPMESASSQQLARMLTEHRASIRRSLNFESSTPLVRLPTYQSLKGMMHGFIDLIFEHQGQYFVCDYKSSHLGDQFEHYHQESLLNNIENNYYDLQYLIYCLALHRHLKNAVENYDPNVHFGGIYYFYLRGMTDDKKHEGAGIYYRKITSQELQQLDEIFRGKKQGEELNHE
jgi:exodeoxyribonuclease V beta subunit